MRIMNLTHFVSSLVRNGNKPVMNASGFSSAIQSLCLKRENLSRVPNSRLHLLDSGRVVLIEQNTARTGIAEFSIPLEGVAIVLHI